MQPIYTPDTCRAAYQLQWSLSVFWRAPQDDETWLDALRDATEPDGVRVLGHRLAGPKTSQFHLSTKPHVAPAEFAQSVKGRLQHILGARAPKAFQRHYSFRSIGSMTRSAVEQYVADQVGHHPMADDRVQAKLADSQIACPDVDLSEPRQSGHARYWYNLHVAFVNDGRWMEVRDDVLHGLRQMILGVAHKRGHRLSRAGIVPDHTHLVLGCSVHECPEDVVLCYMNNLAFTCGMRPVFQFGYYVGTVGEYDTRVV